MALRDERKRLDALFDAVRRKAGPLARLDDEQRNYLAAWQEDQTRDYETMIDSTGELGEGLRGDIKRVLYGDVPTILVTDTDAEAAAKWTRYLERH